VSQQIQHLKHRKAGTPNNNTGTTLSSNANLKSLSLDVEGISPNFNKNITQYNLIVSNTVQNIDVLATPEDPKATVTVTGNTNLNTGINKINITVTAQNGNKKVYTIHVTKTENPELSNAKLENLAIENVLLAPEFNPDVVEYTAQVGSEIENLNVLAVPQREAASVTIEGKDNLKFGDNDVVIRVVAEDKITTSTYVVHVYRKTKEEEAQEEMRALEQTKPEEESQIAKRVGEIFFSTIVVGSTSALIGILLARYKKIK
jgi:azurin